MKQAINQLINTFSGFLRSFDLLFFSWVSTLLCLSIGLLVLFMSAFSEITSMANDLP